VLADVGLTLPDPFAAERSFQLLTQVAGRAGRSARGGKVVMQTFMPENPVIQLAAKHDYAGFYAWEIENRRKLGYPPFARLLRLEYRHRDPVEAEKQAQQLAETLKAQNTLQAIRTIPENLPRLSNYDIIGPAPCFFAKMNDIYRWQVILRGPEPIAQIKTKISDGWRIEVDPPSLL
jgi:primosomal protein N' (replication factor Y)